MKLRLSDVERQRLEVEAANEGRSLSDYCRRLLFPIEVRRLQVVDSTPPTVVRADSVAREKPETRRVTPAADPHFKPYPK